MERQEYLETVEKYVKGKIDNTELLSFGISVKSATRVVFDTEYFQQLFQDRVINFETVVNYFVETDSLEMLIDNVDFFDFLFQKNYCNLRGIAVFLYHISNSERAHENLEMLAQNDVIMKQLLTEEFISFDKLVELFVNADALNELIRAMKQNELSDKNLKILTQKINDLSDFNALCKNENLLKQCKTNTEAAQILSNFMQKTEKLTKDFGADVTFNKYVESLNL